MTLDFDGNFLYLTGGYTTTTITTQSSLSGSNQISKQSSSKNQSSGWIASVYLGGSERKELSVRNIATSSNPIQTVALQNNQLITGGSQSGIKYYQTSTFGKFFITILYYIIFL